MYAEDWEWSLALQSIYDNGNRETISKIKFKEPITLQNFTSMFSYLTLTLALLTKEYTKNIRTEIMNHSNVEQLGLLIAL